MKHLLVCTLLISSMLLGAAVKITVSADRPQPVYTLGETAKFTVKVTDNGKPVSNSKIKLTLSYDGNTIIKDETAELDQNGVAVISGTLDKPGFLRCSGNIVVNRKRTFFTTSAGFDVDKITPAVPAPADFDQFWDEALKKSAAAEADFKMEKLDRFSTAKSTVYKVSVAAPGGRVYGFLRIPCGEGPFGMIVSIPGAGPGVAGPEAENKFPVASLIINVHDYDPMIPGKTIAQSYKELTANGHYIHRSYEYPEKSYLFRAVIGANKLIDCIAALPQINQDKLGYCGSSQGGGFGIILAGLVPGRFQKIVCNIPALCDVNGYLAGRNSGWPVISEKTKYHNELSRRNITYFDAANFARRIRNTEVIIFMGLADTVCAPSSIYAMYNSLTVEKKKLYRFISMAHQVWEKYIYTTEQMARQLSK